MDQKIIDLYDHYTHGGMNRRQFLDRLTQLVGGTAAATTALSLIESNYALAQTIPETDPRIAAETLVFSVGDTKVSGYLVKPTAAGKHPAVIVIHENRGLNPHIKDVTRRVAAAGFVAYGIDILSPLGGTPEDGDKAREMFAGIKPADIVAWLKAARAGLAARPDTNGKVGAIGFCFGGGYVNALAVADPDLAAGVAYYGRQPKAEEVPAIKAPLLLHYGGLDTGLNAGIPAYEAALKANGKSYEIFVYEGANHAFNNDTGGARYSKEAADLAWGRTLAFLRKNLA